MLDEQIIAAIEREDVAFLEKAFQNRECLLEKCPLGFSAKELVQFLGKRPLYPLFSIDIPKVLYLQEANDLRPKSVELKEFENFFSFSYTPTIRFSSYFQLKEAISLCPWLYRKSIFCTEERQLGRRYRKETFFPSSFPYSVRFIDQLIGFGLFAEKTFEKEEFLGIYAGAFMPLDEAQNTAYCFHYPVRWTSYFSYCIDAEKTGNLLRFINHSDRPNVKARAFVIEGVLYTGIFALQPIHKGQELFLYYGSDYWKRRVAQK
jgi:hypothetical protein